MKRRGKERRERRWWLGRLIKAAEREEWALNGSVMGWIQFSRGAGATKWRGLFHHEVQCLTEVNDMTAGSKSQNELWISERQQVNWCFNLRNNVTFFSYSSPLTLMLPSNFLSLLVNTINQQLCQQNMSDYWVFLLNQTFKQHYIKG